MEAVHSIPPGSCRGLWQGQTLGVRPEADTIWGALFKKKNILLNHTLAIADC